MQAAEMADTALGVESPQVSSSTASPSDKEYSAVELATISSGFEALAPSVVAELVEKYAHDGVA
eukprot:4531144-Karenia_brevis.AAC.1